MKTTSPLSATMIGVLSNDSKHEKAKQVFKDESKEVIKHLEGIHHTRKLPHMQTFYSETVNKLSKFQEQTPTNRIVEDKPPPPTHLSNSTIVKLSQYQREMNEKIARERDINERKRDFNREAARKAIVNDIVTGTGPMPKDYLYPQKASHVQILAITGSLKAPNAEIIPPRRVKGKKWLGEGEGWET